MKLLTKNQLKIFAIVCMTLDHIGALQMGLKPRQDSCSNSGSTDKTVV